MGIIIYGKPDATCFGCKKTKELFTAAGVEFTFIDITREANEAERVYVTTTLGYMQAPVVMLSETDHWSGLDPKNIDRAIAMLTNT